MISFSQIANPPMPPYRPICGNCEGRGVVPIARTMSVDTCSECNGIGRKSNELMPADEVPNE
jgi:DnaJ-class molecular chaperone